MRRDEFLENNPEEIQKVLDSEKIGYLGILTEAGFPRVVPLNFAARSDRIYFHGALSGEKHDLLAKSPRVTFSVARQYALIPSYWMAKGHACPATTFYKSVYVEGICNLVENADEKTAVLELIMRKYQPGGGYPEISNTDSRYIKPVEEVAVFVIKCRRTQLKSKFGQNLSEKVRLQLIDRLLERNYDSDRETVAEM